MGTWTNSDGLHIKMGVDEGFSASTAGEYKTYGPTRMVEIEVDLTELTATETILNDVVMLPAGAQIESVEVIAEVAAATGTAIDVGLIRLDRSTELDYDGILAAFATATMNVVGERTTLINGTSTGGALIGTVLAYAGYISASRTDATAFTAGRVKIRISYAPKATSTN